MSSANGRASSAGGRSLDIAIRISAAYSGSGANRRLHAKKKNAKAAGEHRQRGLCRDVPDAGIQRIIQVLLVDARIF